MTPSYGQLLKPKFRNCSCFSLSASPILNPYQQGLLAFTSKIFFLLFIYCHLDHHHSWVHPLELTWMRHLLLLPLTSVFSAFIVMLSDYLYHIFLPLKPSLAPYYTWNETETPWCGWLIHTSSWSLPTLLASSHISAVAFVHYSDLPLFSSCLLLPSDLFLIAIFCSCNSFLGFGMLVPHNSGLNSMVLL